MTQQSPTDLLDLVIVGAGVGGLAVLRHAKRKGLKAVLCEKASDVGGLWRDLPPWQDIQTRREDWTIDRFPIEGENQKSIHKNLKSYVSLEGLSELIQLNCGVKQAIPESWGWTVKTERGMFRARYLVAATGAHNIPYVPQVSKTNIQVQEFHSATLPDTAFLKGKRVTVVGGGASAFDVLDHCFRQGAKEVHWVYRKVKWFFPTLQPKYHRANIRDLARYQMLGTTTSKMNETLNSVLNARYAKAGLNAIRPRVPFDYDKEQIIPGRSEMIRNFETIHLHPGEISGLDGNRVTVAGESFETDVVVYCTGYKLDLSYLGLPKLGGVKSIAQLTERCGTLFLSLDYDNLFFFGIAALDANGSTPVNFDTVARTVVAHIRGKCSFPKTVINKKVNHWDLIKLMASFDRSNYFPLLWRVRYLFLSLWYYRHQDKPVSFGK